ncbi:MAG: hypothetical protein IT477_10530 [Rhodanobacteraceae bacterium]|nr:hypothetical protein [Rhodanobacteraceae bacterium]
MPYPFDQRTYPEAIADARNPETDSALLGALFREVEKAPAGWAPELGDAVIQHEILMNPAAPAALFRGYLEPHQWIYAVQNHAFPLHVLENPALLGRLAQGERIVGLDRMVDRPLPNEATILLRAINAVEAAGVQSDQLPLMRLFAQFAQAHEADGWRLDDAISHQADDPNSGDWIIGMWMASLYDPNMGSGAVSRRFFHFYWALTDVFLHPIHATTPAEVQYRAMAALTRTLHEADPAVFPLEPLYPEGALVVVLVGVDEGGSQGRLHAMDDRGIDEHGHVERAVLGHDLRVKPHAAQPQERVEGRLWVARELAQERQPAAEGQRGQVIGVGLGVGGQLQEPLPARHAHLPELRIGQVSRREPLRHGLRLAPQVHEQGVVVEREAHVHGPLEHVRHHPRVERRVLPGHRFFPRGALGRFHLEDGGARGQRVPVKPFDTLFAPPFLVVF